MVRPPVQQQRAWPDVERQAWCRVDCTSDVCFSMSKDNRLAHKGSERKLTKSEHASHAAATLLGGSDAIECRNTGTDGETWAFDPGHSTLLVRFPLQPLHADAPPGAARYDEALLRKLYVYVEFNTSYVARPEEISGRCAFSAPGTALAPPVAAAR